MALAFALFGCGRAGAPTPTPPPEFTPLAATAAPATVTPPPRAPTASPLADPTASAAPTDTRLPATPTPRPPTAAGPSVTPTLDLSPTCPPTDKALTLNLEPVFNANPLYPELEEPILGFMNAGGTYAALARAFNFADPASLARLLRQADLTGDGVPEIVVTGARLLILGCAGGQYVTFINNRTNLDRLHITYLGDMNLDGLSELVVTDKNSFGRGPNYETRIIGWDGQAFQSLIAAEYYGRQVDFAEVTGSVSVEDVDQNGTLELVVVSSDHGPFVIESSWCPPTTWIDTYAWDGAVFLQDRQPRLPLTYRYEAVQLADEASEAGDYDGALAWYQEVIFSDLFDWWSPERRRYLIDTWQRPGEGTPTPAPPLPDPDEYFYLAAYSRYRIYLLHTVRGWTAEAQVVYDTLQSRFPPGQTGHIYAELATAFRDGYEPASNIERGCSNANAFARGHSEAVLTPLSVENGYACLSTTNVCPFK